MHIINFWNGSFHTEDSFTCNSVMSHLYFFLIMNFVHKLYPSYSDVIFVLFCSLLFLSTPPPSSSSGVCFRDNVVSFVTVRTIYNLIVMLHSMIIYLSWSPFWSRWGLLMLSWTLWVAEPHWEKTTWRKLKVELCWKARLAINLSGLD